MKYALLVYTKPGSHESLSEAELRSVSAEYMALREEPGFLDGGQLQPVHTATSVRVGNGQTLVTDGPFAETREVFGGYYIFDVEDLDRALDLAARIPAARLGGVVEVRPLVEAPSAVVNAPPAGV
jgi:hypothetical protein